MSREMRGKVPHHLVRRILYEISTVQYDEVKIFILPSLYAWYLLPFSSLCFKMLEPIDVVELARL